MVESTAVQGLVKMVYLDGQQTDHRLSNLALIALADPKHGLAGGRGCTGYSATYI